MRFITVTSDSYLSCTRLMLESLRVWHPQSPVTVYALERGWHAGLESAVEALGADVQVVPERDSSHRGGILGTAVFAAWKLDVFAAQSDPFVYLDADTLVLRPLDAIFAAVRGEGWFSVNEGTTLGQCHQGEVCALMDLPVEARELPCFNTGVIGCDPARHRELFELARDWAERIRANFMGDEGLLNLAWFHLRGRLPASASTVYNGGWYADGQIELGQSVLHFARPGHEGPKDVHQARVWSHWPRGLRLVNLRETPFWQDSLPHPWPWLNQCTRRAYWPCVRRLRAASRSLLGLPWLLIRDHYESYLLDRQVLAEQFSFWRQQAHLVAGLNHRPTYHLPGAGRPPRRVAPRLRRMLSSLRSHAPL